MKDKIIEQASISKLLEAMFDESPLALDEYFDGLSDEDKTFAAGFINGFMWCMMADNDDEQG